MNSYILAVDGGATKTTLSLRDASGKIYFEKTSTSTNYQAIGIEKAEKAFSQLLHEAYEATGIQDIAVAAFAVAGIDTKKGQTIVQQIVEQSCRKSLFRIQHIIVENDVQSTLIGLTGNDAGALVISGTGSTAYATDGKGRIERTGGWGHRVGDEGSGYWIGREILNTVFRYEDGRLQKPTVLKDLVYEMLQIDHIEQLNDWIYQTNYTNAQIAKISTVLSKAISLGDERAIDIACNAAKELVIMTDAVLRKIEPIHEGFIVYLNGGVLKNNPVILKLYKEYMMEQYPHISFDLCNQNPIDYIANRALRSLK
ncbi:N-acetylglucosamine kinase [Ureibacillus thermophilus]|nr:BadF/BadG/BcrA/BcrD ATPase family protein [Ureibacillus thermophilus]